MELDSLTNLLGVLFLYGVLCTDYDTDGEARGKVVLILYDGFRWDYLDIPGLEGFTHVQENGAWVEKMTMAFPTQSYPQYYTIMTGLYAENHGIVKNNFYDPLYDEVWFAASNPGYDHPHFYNDGEPVWVTATRQGKKGALYYWPGCEVTIRNVTPALCDPYFNSPDRIDIRYAFEKTLDNLKEGYDFIGIYVEDIDKMGHKFGPFSIEVNESVSGYDKELVTFLDALKARDLADSVNVILVSDHGMSAYDSSGRDCNVDITKAFTVGEFVNSIKFVLNEMIYPKYPNMTNFIYNRLKNLHPHVHFFLREDFPERYHFSNDRRIAPILYYCDPPYYTSTMINQIWEPPPGELGRMGDHGYLPDLDDMKAFIKGARQSDINSVDIYQLVCKILAIEPAPHNGTWENLVDITIYSSSRPSLGLPTTHLNLLTLSLLVSFYHF
ncbi:glycerophosphocholine cholinephosphodiesterase ENPP6-like isoform X2 [Lineus longissimus]|uniref:glycerophosphocholine cholinephosphodiesterase ENPP6-like isoform X2 n=1 Tax=Lineus longissimus TaxID=88925 RepID=UPI00315D5674